MPRRRQAHRAAAHHAAAAPPRAARGRRRARSGRRRLGHSRARSEALSRGALRRCRPRARAGARGRSRGLPPRLRRGLFRSPPRGAGRAPVLRRRASVGVHRREPAARGARHAGGPRGVRGGKAPDGEERHVSARIIDGKAIAAAYRAELKLRVDRLRGAGIVPTLAVVIVGDDPASKVYVRNKALAAEAIGMRSHVHAMAASVTQAQLVAFVRNLDADDAIHGVLVQLPLPRHVDSRAVIEAIAPEKDVDGFHYFNVGSLVHGEPAFYPCTPWGIMKMLEHEGIAVEGMRAAVVGRSTVVGKPMALMLINANATVTVCHSKTRDLASVTREADLIVAAVGKPRMLTAAMVKPGAIVIDVGINRLADGRLAGDVDFEGVSAVASRITPVPGGVGPMTIAMLLANTVKAAERVAGLAVRAETRIA